MDDARRDLLLELDTDDPEFARGFELGRVWAFLLSEERPVQAMLRGANAEHAMRIAEALGRGTRAETINGGWLDVTFSDTRGSFAEPVTV